MIAVTPNATDILAASATATTASLITIPANHWFCGQIALSATAALAGTAAPTVTFTPSGTGTGPTTTTVVARTVATGLLAASTSNSTVQDVVFYGGDSGAHLDYTAAAAGSSSCVIHGFVI